MSKNAETPGSSLMPTVLPKDGGASMELQQRVESAWKELAVQCGIDLTEFDARAPLESRIAWAIARGLSVATILTRFSTKAQASTWDQARHNLEFAARNAMYCPPELLCVDEAITGSKEQRPGLDCVRAILRARYATVLIVFKLSRLQRHAHKMARFIEEEVVEEGLRAVSTSQGIDTAAGKGWRLLVGLHGAMDEDLLTAIGDHVREGLVSLFQKGWTTGALPIGYKPVPVPNGPLTRRGHPRTMPAVDEAAAAMIQQHARLIVGGMPLMEGRKKWRADDGPVDPRCKTGEMSYQAYYRMLIRPDYIGIREFCRKRNVWSSKLDSMQQKPRPQEEVRTFRCEELRIIDDETYLKLRQILLSKQTGPRRRRSHGEGEPERHLWDMITGLYHCPHCVDCHGKPRRFYMSGARGQYMRCSNPDCPAPAMIHRQEAAVALCADLSGRLRADRELISLVVQSFAALPPDDVEGVKSKLAAAERRERHLRQKIGDTEALLGSGDADARQRRRNQIVADERELAAAQLELLHLRRRQQGGVVNKEPITHQRVEACLAQLLELLHAAASGRLGKDLIGRGAMIVSCLVGGSVMVHSERRPGRSHWLVCGTYVPCLLRPLQEELGGHADAEPAQENGSIDRSEETPSSRPIAQVWLRQPPRVDRIADEVREMYDVNGLGFRVINNLLEKKYGEAIGSGNICAAYRRWYESRGLPLPPRRTNAGRPRRKTA